MNMLVVGSGGCPPRYELAFYRKQDGESMDVDKWSFESGMWKGWVSCGGFCVCFVFIILHSFLSNRRGYYPLNY